MIKKFENNIPLEIMNKLDKTYNDVICCLEEAYSLLKGLELNVNLVFQHNAPSNILNDEDRYQQVCFITRFECLPDIGEIMIEEKSGNYYFANLDYLRHILNEYRLVLFNKGDSIYFRKLHKFCYCKLANNDPSKGLSIKAFDTDRNDRTNDFIKLLNQSTKAIEFVIKCSDLDYVYNGILQHTDTRHTKRYWKDYYSGEINYLFLKNATLVCGTKDLMNVYYKIMNTMTFPVLGSL